MSRQSVAMLLLLALLAAPAAFAAEDAPAADGESPEGTPDAGDGGYEGGYYYDYYYSPGYDEYSDYDVPVNDYCTISENKEQVLVNGDPACDIMVSEVSSLTGLPGNIHGLYYAWDCKNGRPLYIRHEQSEPDAVAPLPVTLFYSQYFGDWEFQVPGIQFMKTGVDGSKLNDAIVAFAGNRSTLTPETIQPEMLDGTWFIKSKLSSTASEDDYVEALDLKITCAGAGNGGGDAYADEGTHAVAVILLFSLLASAVVCGVPAVYFFKRHKPNIEFSILQPEKESAA